MGTGSQWSFVYPDVLHPALMEVIKKKDYLCQKHSHSKFLDGILSGTLFVIVSTYNAERHLTLR